MDVAVHADEAGLLERLRLRDAAPVETEVEAVAPGDGEHVVVDRIDVREAPPSRSSRRSGASAGTAWTTAASGSSSRPPEPPVCGAPSSQTTALEASGRGFPSRNEDDCARQRRGAGGRADQHEREGNRGAAKAHRSKKNNSDSRRDRAEPSEYHRRKRRDGWTRSASRSSERTPDPTRPRPVRTTQSASTRSGTSTSKHDENELARMIQLSGGRDVPVIFDAGTVTVGFGGT